MIVGLKSETRWRRERACTISHLGSRPEPGPAKIELTASKIGIGFTYVGCEVV